MTDYQRIKTMVCSPARNRPPIPHILPLLKIKALRPLRSYVGRLLASFFLISVPLIAPSQDTVSICNTSIGLGLTGELTGTYWANFISLDSAWVHDADLYATRYFVSESMIDSTASLHIVNCTEAAEACTDRYIPGIAVLGDSSIRDEEWEENYADVLTDSAAFFSIEAMMLYQKFGVKAVDDCGINQFFVTSLEIEPPGGVDRPSGTRTFRINFRAVDFAGRVKEAQMIWVRDNTGI